MEVKWIKIDTDIFNDEKIAIIESLPDADADSVIIIWFKLLCLAGRQNNNGVFILNDEMPFTDEMFAAIFRRPVASVKKALGVFQSLGMIEILDNVVTIPNWEKHQNIDKLDAMRAKSRESSKKYRERQKLLASGDVTVMSPSGHGDGIDEEKEQDVDYFNNDDELLIQNNNKKDKEINKGYGINSNIILTDEEFERLKRELNDYCNGVPSWQYYLDYMSNQAKKNGKSYTLADIIQWYRDDKAKGWRTFSAAPQQASYDLTAFEKKDLQPPVYKRKKK